MAVFLTSTDDSPEALLDAPDAPAQMAVAYRLPRFWEAGDAADALIAIYERQPNGAIHFLVQPDGEALRAKLAQFEGDLAELAAALECEVFSEQWAIGLNPVHIPKPWGEEIWYTGMEDRGVARAGHAATALPLPWVLSALPQRLCGNREQAIVLLKILAPRPEEVFGDLYFELHEEKREVYVVTAVDETAWPYGTGAIRFGFSPAKRAEIGDDRTFREAFRRAVADYESVRREIDTLIDERAQREGQEPNREAWLADLPPSLVDAEQRLRAEMNSYTALKPLKVGDVVKVPTLTPHALQHGVRTVEFQTPVYERLIVAFAQKVLTQDHWDTDKATELMNLDAPEPEPLALLYDGEGVTEERIVDFEDFEVRRLILAPGASVVIEAPGDYAVVMVVQGELPLGPEAQCPLGPEQAVLLPRNWAGGSLTNSGEETGIFLLAYPR